MVSNVAVVVGIALAALSSGTVWVFSSVPMVAVGPPVWLVAGPPGVEIDARVRLSPDGRTLAFGGVIGGTSQVYLRHLDQLGAVPLAGTEGTRPLAFSPDGRELLVADYTGVARNVSAIATVSRVSLTGGPLRTVAQGHGAQHGDQMTR